MKTWYRIMNCKIWVHVHMHNEELHGCDNQLSEMIRIKEESVIYMLHTCFVVRQNPNGNYERKNS